MKKVLLISTGNIARGGVQKFLEEWIGASKNQYQYTWYCCGENYDNELKESFESLGVEVIDGNINLRKATRYFFFAKDLRKELSKNTYDIVHINTGVILYAFVALNVAKRQNIPQIIVHSHNSSERRFNMFEQKVLASLQKNIRQSATNLVACSEKAAEWMFGCKGETEVPWVYIRNKIDVSKYQFNPDTREKYRREIQVSENCLVLGTVGRLSPVKNQMYLLDIMKELKRENRNIKLLIIGTGTLEEKIRQKVKELQLEDYVLLLGERRNVNQWLQAMDVFLMPSLHEGFPIAAIEAQASGLPCLFADNFSPETKLREDVFFLPLDNIAVWKKTIMQIYNQRESFSNRDGATTVIKQEGFDKNSFFEEIQNLYS
uniref:glycosyltransferase n=1 Tax=Lachnoclostridium phocaeense TaxID=1871021 RepID=UPI0026DDC872|nr:glycosyltransferase [Lachnoclostridium phocaeense]